MSQSKNTLNAIVFLIVFSIGSKVLGFLREALIAPIFMKILAYGFQGEQFDLAVKLFRLGLPSVYFAAVHFKN